MADGLSTPDELPTDARRYGPVVKHERAGEVSVYLPADRASRASPIMASYAIARAQMKSFGARRDADTKLEASVSLPISLRRLCRIELSAPQHRAINLMAD